nr:hypothetical protein [Rhodococcus yunnanensis]
MMPSDTMCDRKFASSASTVSETAIMSPNDDRGSPSRARMYAEATPAVSRPPIPHVSKMVSSRAPATATPAGERCLNDAATGFPIAVRA